MIGDKMRVSADFRQPISEEERRRTEHTLGRILASPAFAPSPRSREFLAFIVRQAADTDAPPLTERRIAAEVFGKTENFNPAEDSAVRVKASEVRKRLAAYYAAEGASDRIRIELPPGCYSPEFRANPAPDILAARRPRRMWVYACVLAPATVALLLWFFTGRSSAEDRFWGPVLHGPGPVVLCVPFRVGVRFSDDVTAMRIGQADESPPGTGLRVPMIGLGDSLGLARLTALCGRRAAPYQVKISNEVTFADFRQQPAVILGGRWSRDIVRDMRFAFASAPARVVDRSNPSRSWPRANLVSGEGPGEDYAIIARLRSWNAGQPVVIGVGMSTFGTQAAAEFLTSPASIEELVRRGPADWEHRNLQAIVQTRVIGKTPGRPKLIAVHFW